MKTVLTPLAAQGPSGNRALCDRTPISRAARRSVPQPLLRSLLRSLRDQRTRTDATVST
jgi:hypothetical protein